jgi:hypothetical protein
MMRFVPLILAASAIAASATAALAQSYPAARYYDDAYYGPRNVPHVTVPAYQWPYNRTCCVLGPAYGQPGEPLGPGRWDDHYTNMRVCGPGACQDNPLY